MENKVIKTRKPFCYVTTAGQVVRANVLESYVIKQKGESESKQLTDVFGTQYAAAGLITPIYNPTSLAYILELNTYHMRACKTKARDTAGLGWELSALKENASKTAHAELLKTFNDLGESLQVTLDRASVDFESLGYGVIEVVRVGYKPDGKLAGIYHMPAEVVRFHKDGNKCCQMIGARQRWFKFIGYDKDVHQDTGAESKLGSVDTKFRANEAMWWINYSPRSIYYGLPDVMPALGAIHGDISRRDYNMAFFDNYGVPAYAVFVTGNFDPGEENDKGQTALEESIQEHFQAIAKNPHSVLVMSVPTSGDTGEVNVEFVPLAKEVKEASFRLYRQDNRDEVLAAHGVPPYRCGISEMGSLGGNVALEATRIYKTSVIEPRQNLIEDLFNRYIVREMYGVEDWQWELTDIDTSDEAAEVSVATQLFGDAVFTPNDLIRIFGAKYGVEPDYSVAALDYHYLTGQPLELLGQQPSVPAPASTDGTPLATAGNGHGGADAVIEELRQKIIDTVSDVVKIADVIEQAVKWNDSHREEDSVGEPAKSKGRVKSKVIDQRLTDPVAFPNPDDLMPIPVRVKKKK